VIEVTCYVLECVTSYMLLLQVLHEGCVENTILQTENNRCNMLQVVLIGQTTLDSEGMMNGRWSHMCKTCNQKFCKT
jgi:hypothetical protein